ncbi:tripartite tricarboxylate transporter permease [Consotaella salsifontis]|uniref:Putative tricarboxylic transport membrane protein n=1 Tax=Consotaella salsifontis TaxID=1365950 RepID=A0A1T4MQM5_9HYPH|nr:tripartite tricarboxylate transporter permease [Consotaella salsifontis]SJZ69312.1 putative tricarboxylic transport membrane protein [Consotaella salsifontis]
MIEILQNLAYGFTICLTPENLLYVTLGGAVGTVIGMLPGLGPATGVAVLLPMTYFMGPTGALITMCGIYYGAMFGGSRASILLNTPGDGAAVAACFDGYPMARNGKAESALAISAIASFIGGLIGAVIFVFAAVYVARFALRFGPGEYFALMIFALVATASLSRGNLLRGLVSTAMGLMVSTIGLDGLTGVDRYTFGFLELMGGLDFLIVIIGFYALVEVYKCANPKTVTRQVQTKFGPIWITKEEWRRCLMPILRQAPIGFLIGVLPGAGGTMASMMAYSNEKQLSKTPEAFGKGEIVGLAAPESANNACSIGALIPMLTLGIPGSGVTAVMMGALLMLGLQPGPTLFQDHPDIVWGLTASMFVGNIICAIINLPLASLLVRVLSVPGRILYPSVLGLAYLGIYAISDSAFDFYPLILFGLLGLVLDFLDIPTSPFILAAIVGNMMETNFRRALKMSGGDMGVFVNSSISIVLYLLTIIILLLPLYRSWRARHTTVPSAV